jgi:hypothetical protein
MKIEIYEIEFKEMSSLILLKEDYKGLGFVELSKQLGFEISDIKKVHKRKINIEDFPKKEWSC